MFLGSNRIYVCTGKDEQVRGKSPAKHLRDAEKEDSTAAVRLRSHRMRK